MKNLQNSSVLLFLIDSLSRNGSWCGETHIQKAVYLLQEAGEVPTGFEFILYKHGPFSFDLRLELTALQANNFIEIHCQDPYGPSLLPTTVGKALFQIFNEIIAQYKDRIEQIATFVGGKKVKELEKLATALYIHKKEPAKGIEEKAIEINTLKRHISIEEAIESLRTIESLLAVT
jgi:hypothetical protein